MTKVQHKDTVRQHTLTTRTTIVHFIFMMFLKVATKASRELQDTLALPLRLV